MPGTGSVVNGCRSVYQMAAITVLRKAATVWSRTRTRWSLNRARGSGDGASKSISAIGGPQGPVNTISDEEIDHKRTGNG
jgi:hypothetical protein